MANEVIIKRGLRLGDLEAETDRELLNTCFIDNGELELVLNVSRPESVILGRTGAGKSAVLIKIEDSTEYCKKLDPNDISIRFLESSDIIQFFESIGVNLDLFYKLLWRHILTIELLKMRYKLSNQQDSESMWRRLFEWVSKDPVREQALSYFKEWGEKFWLDTDQQLREVVNKISKDLKAGMSTDLAGVNLTLEGAKNISEEQKTVIVNKANKVVSQIQISKLAKILGLLQDKVFDDSQKKYYLLIDKLDEEWAETTTRYRFIRALIEEIKTFRKIDNVKIIIALRKDLLDMVFDKTRDSGFQQEKYESDIIPLHWTRDSLYSLLEKRINQVYKLQYTKANVHFDDVFPSPRKGGGIKAIDYILERTLLRPRDVLQFANEAFIAAVNSPRISWNAISKAESIYSDKRLKSLFEEWDGVYPALKVAIEMLRSKPVVITRSHIADSIDDFSDKLSDYPNDPCGKAIIDYCNSTSGAKISDVVAELIICFHRVGVIGVKISTKDRFKWADYDQSILNKGEVLKINQIKIHKMLHKTLGIREKDVYTDIMERENL